MKQKITVISFIAEVNFRIKRVSPVAENIFRKQRQIKNNTIYYGKTSNQQISRYHFDERFANIRNYLPESCPMINKNIHGLKLPTNNIVNN